MTLGFNPLNACPLRQVLQQRLPPLQAGAELALAHGRHGETEGPPLCPACFALPASPASRDLKVSCSRRKRARGGTPPQWPSHPQPTLASFAPWRLRGGGGAAALERGRDGGQGVPVGGAKHHGGLAGRRGCTAARQRGRGGHPRALSKLVKPPSGNLRGSVLAMDSPRTQGRWWVIRGKRKIKLGLH